MRLLGLTGGVGMGKTATARMFADLGFPVHDADAAVARVYGAGGEGGEALEGAFGLERLLDGSVDREGLRRLVMGDDEKMEELERLIHPLVGREREGFLKGARDSGAWMAVLDVPLLYETGGDKKVDAVVAATAPEEVRRARVLAREGMTPQRLDALLKRQLLQEEKVKRADYVVETHRGFDFARRRVKEIAEELEGRWGRGGGGS